MDFCGTLGREVPSTDRPTLRQSLNFKEFPQAAVNTWALAPTPQIGISSFQVKLQESSSKLLYTYVCIHPPVLGFALQGVQKHIFGSSRGTCGVVFLANGLAFIWVS